MMPNPLQENIDAHRWTQRDNRYVAFSRHARFHMEEYEMDTLIVIDMLNTSFKCQTRGRFTRRDHTEICSNFDHICFRLVLGEDFCENIHEYCWVVVNVEPA
jgi:hypothetical protein